MFVKFDDENRDLKVEQYLHVCNRKQLESL
jgi:hypothetical protein